MKNGSALGIDIGSTSVKACLVGGGAEVWSEVRAHDGDVAGTVRALLGERGVGAGVPALVTGGEGRRQFQLASAIATEALERALEALALDVCAIVSVGGEDLVVYRVDGGRIVGTYAGNKCASGTGEFFAQQLRRMDLPLDAVHLPAVAGGTVHRLSSRCSVFMKSDCTHKLNKGEADKHDIVLSLSHVMARKVLEFLAKARITSGRVVLAGGGTRNPHLVAAVREGLPGVELVVPDEAAYVEAFGAALLAAERGAPMPCPEALVSGADLGYARGRPLSDAQDHVTFLPARRGRAKAGRAYVLGIDGGSTTTKVAIVDAETREIVASHYGRTLGDPVVALRRCLDAVRAQLEEQVGSEDAIELRLAATTGSSRELLGVYCGTPAVYNEIMAHTAGVTALDPAIDTIFEIGGQDAKYVHLSNLVPVDYAMNEACSAGTGSFLEESAAGDLDIHRPEEIGPIALQATAPLRFGEHCSAFINSDIRKAIQGGASRPDIVAGLTLSIVANYLNRVVGNRRVGSRIVLQGGVAKNPAVPLAFAQLLGKHVVVPPDPELMGAYGVALMALARLAEGRLQPSRVRLAELAGRTIRTDREYRCKACENHCPIKIMAVGAARYHFGGRCNKFANLRRKPVRPQEDVKDWVEVRRQLYFETYAAPADDLPRANVRVGVPEALSVHSLWPLYSNFFHALGVRTVLEARVSEKGTARCESSYCFPGEIAHGQMGSLLEADPRPDFWFLPHLKALPSYEKTVHACLCPITQGLPYALRTAFELDDARLLRPVLDLTRGFADGAEPMMDVAERLGRTREEGRKAWALAVERQQACFREGLRLGRQAVEEAERGQWPAIVLFGRPYNAFAPGANMGIPRKFATRGYSVIPFDFLEVGPGEEILPNMYWYYGQQDLKGAVRVKGSRNLFATFVTNFSCAPDSFILHFNRWIYGSKPFLTLELDSHSADAGVDTRVEAFLDVVEAWRRSPPREATVLPERKWDVAIEGGDAWVVNRTTGERRSMKDPRVTLVWPSMGQESSALVARISRSHGINSVALPPADIETAPRARAVASGKECIPALLVLGAVLDYLAKAPKDPDHVHLVFMPITTGPCRTGQYAIFYQALFQELGVDNVVMLSLNSDNSYSELGNNFNRDLWRMICVGDYFRDVVGTLRALAVDRAAALAEADAVLQEMLAAAEGGTAPVLAGLRGWGRRLAGIPLKAPLASARKALVVGEIFVRRDDFSVDTLVGRLADAGVVAKITGLTEWVHYLDWDQRRRLRKALGRMPLLRRLGSKELRTLLWLRIETIWKGRVERAVKGDLGLSGLVPESPHGMDRIMARSGEFASFELESEATLSPASAAVAMDEGYDGVAIISPFACLPGRLIEATYAPWARARGMPVVAVESDGNAYPPSVVSRIEAFAHDVARGVRRRPPKLTVVPSRYADVADLDLLSCSSGGCGGSCGAPAAPPAGPVRVELKRAEPKAQKPTGS
ncbi:MAG TPA: anhydro-N-acetylmuramic acid kinase [Anaeromyxobacteraceae bacterium]|nr:anhydro-N-acetylmuramic acid kinase [Anaeromyxobacteraceae bacterium]